MNKQTIINIEESVKEEKLQKEEKEEEKEEKNEKEEEKIGESSVQ